jgi:carbamoyl-phosphate synthase large subunit
MGPVVAITGLNATDNPAPGVAVARALRAAPDFDGRIVGLSYDMMDPGNFAQDLFDDVFLVPYPSQGTEAMGERLRHVHAAVGLDALVATLDSELPGLIALEPMLHELGVGTFQPTREQLDLRSKVNLEELGRDADLSVPDTVVITDPSELAKVHEQVPYPFVMKGVFYGAQVVHTYGDALAAYHSILAKWGGPVLVQAFVKGEEIDVAAVGDGEGGLLGAVPMKKTVLTDKGKGWAGVAIKDPEVMRLTERFMAASYWRGGCEVEIVRDHDGGYHLLEINPRFPAWIYMSAAAGPNLPWMAVRKALGRHVERDLSYKVGTTFVRISLDQIVDMADIESLATAGELHRPASGESR